MADTFAGTAAERTSDNFIHVPGGRVFVRRWHHLRPAARQRPPLLLLHESLGCVEQWRDLPAKLACACGRDVIAYDRLGFGRSSARDALPGFDFITEEVQMQFPALREALQLERFALFGHSVGGSMALAIAGEHGDGCAAVVSESAQAFVEQRTLDGIVAGKARFTDADAFNRLARYHGGKARWVLDAWTQVWTAPEFRGWSLDAELARVRCPVLVIHGDADDYGSLAFPQRIADRCDGPVTLDILRPCGHVPHRERTSDVLQATARFLEQHAN